MSEAGEGGGRGAILFDEALAASHFLTDGLPLKRKCELVPGLMRDRGS